jgi:glycosyltransferase involved in cell wall biosynthesis
MKILMVNKFHHLKTGTERYMFDLSDLMRSHGHEVIHFSMRDDRNVPCEHSGYFVSPFNAEPSGLYEIVTNSLRVIYSREAKRQMGRLIEKTKPDAAFIHNIYHQISPSILPVIKKHGIPILMHVADYKLVCPNYLLYTQGRICEDCAGGAYYNAVRRKCLKRSTLKSLLVCCEMYIHKLLKIYEKNVDFFLCPGKHQIDVFSRMGLNDSKLIHLPLALQVIEHAPHFSVGSYVIFFGRLFDFKGAFTLLKAMEKTPRIKLVIAGDGDQRQKLEAYKRERSLGHIDFVGFRHGEDLMELIRNSAFSIVPSEWYEVYGLNIIESFASGKPVIGSRIGNLPNLIDDGETGLLFRPGDENDLAEKIAYLHSDPKLVVEMGKNARDKVERQLNLDAHYNSIMDLFDKCGGGRRVQ